MSNIYPFKAITSINGIHNQLTSCSHSWTNNNPEIYENKIKYINYSLKENLYKYHTEGFYCCRISNNNFVIIGLIALINADSLNKTIFGHEKCIDIKKQIYLELFKKYNIQLSPIILMHEDNLQINASLNSLFTKNIPFLTTSDEEYKYEIWAINDLDHYEKLYSQVDTFLIADGHHRISSINALSHNNKFITAYLVSAAHIKSFDIYRKYSEVSEPFKRKLSLFLKNNFELTKIDNIDVLNLSKNFLCKIDDNIYAISNHNTKDIINVLEFLDKSINYKNNRLNFYNYPYNKVNNLLSGSKDVALVIPALKKINNIKTLPLYPPHSTLFYPKLPDGLILNLL